MPSMGFFNCFFYIKAKNALNSIKGGIDAQKTFVPTCLSVFPRRQEHLEHAIYN